MRYLRIAWLVAAMLSLSGAQVYAQYTTADTLRAVVPGLVYKEFSRIITTNANDWRVTDPSAPFVGDPSNSPSTYLPNSVLSLSVADLQDAIKVVAVIDVWGGHVGTVGKQFRLNGHSWIDVPSINNTPASPECYTHQYSVEVEVPLADLVQGVNALEGTSGGQTCYNFGWGQWGWYGFLLRVYYDPGTRAAPTGSIVSPVSGATLGENPVFEAVASSAAGVSRVEFVGYYDEFDSDGDGAYLGWQESRHRLRLDNAMVLRNHLGTASNAPYDIVWDNAWVPEQAPGSIKAVGRIRDANGLWYVTEQVTGLSLSRPGLNVRFYKADNVPQKYWVRAGETKSSNFVIGAGDDLATVQSARLHVVTWNGVSGQAEPGEQHWTQVNGWTAPEYGENHFYSHDRLDIPPNILQNGTNTVAFYSGSSHHGAEILWPGPGLVVRYVDYSNVVATVTEQPTDILAVEGFTATFSVVAVGANPLAFQWQENGTDILGATDSAYTTPILLAGNDGDLYRCVVSNGLGSDVSREAVLTVLVPGPRNTTGQIVLYDFDEGGGSTVNDASGIGLPVDLSIADVGAVSWVPGGLSVDAATVIASAGAATKISAAVMVSNEITLEAWLKPSNLTQNGPARIVTLSPNLFSRNLTLGQGVFDGASDVYEVRMRSTATSLNGTPALATPVGDLKTQLTHVVYTRNAAGVTKIFINGVERATGSAAGDFSNWDSTFQLGLANELTGDRPWFGELHLVALFDRALPAADILQNFAAGPTTAAEINVNVFPVQALAGLVFLFALPNGQGDALSAGQSWDGVTGAAPTLVDATIGVQIVNGLGEPVVGFPADKITVTSQNGGWVSCPDFPLTADGPTDATGTTTISGALYAGGFSGPGELLQVSIADPSLGTITYPDGLPGLEYFIQSADLSGDLSVDLTDVSVFAGAFGSAVFDGTADYFHDGVINLSDVVKLGIGFGSECDTLAGTEIVLGQSARDGLPGSAAGLSGDDFAFGEKSIPRPVLRMVIAPNPFNPMTEIRFSLPVDGSVELRIYDMRGQLLTTLIREVMTAGEHRVVWNGTDRSGRAVASGVYFSKLQTRGGNLLEKMVLVR